MTIRSCQLQSGSSLFELPNEIEVNLEMEEVMSDSDQAIASTSDFEDVDSQADQTRQPVKKRSRFGVFLKWMLLCFLVMQLYMRLIWEPAWGDAIENLITVAQIQVSAICIMFWWFFCSPFPRRIVWPLGMVMVAAIAGWISSIRTIDFDGDMNASIQYKWEKTPTEVLDEFRQSAEQASIDKIDDVVEFAPEDMPAYRGIHRDGVVIGPSIRKDWNANPPTELWRHPIGGGYSSFAVVDPVLVTMEQRGNDECVVSYDIETGQEFWVHSYPAYFDALGGPGPRSTPTLHDNSVYSFGCYGDLFCLDLKTGAKKWHVNVLQQFQLPTTTWGMTSSPLIHNGNVIVNIGGLKQPELSGPDQPANGLAAYNLESGELVWQSAGLPEGGNYAEFRTGVEAIKGIEGLTLPGYASPMMANVAGQEIILNYDGTALRGSDPANGAELWKYPVVAGDFINAAQPIMLDENRVFFSSGYGVGSFVIELSHSEGKWSFEERWKSMRLRCKFSSALLHDGYLYGLDEGIMVCIDASDGKRMWKGRRSGLRGRYGHGQMLLVDGHIVVLTEKGDLVLIEPSPEELKVHSIIKVLDEDVKTWNPLSIAYGKAFVRNATEIACFDLRASANSSQKTGEVVDAYR